MKKFKITAAEKKTILEHRTLVKAQDDVFIDEFTFDEFLEVALDQGIPPTKKAVSKLFKELLKEIVSGANRNFKSALPALVSELKESTEME